MIGSQLGPYQVTAKLGEGGMGEVYRARDSKLERDVAIKVLPAAFVEDPERLQRFEREARLLAQLNHSNIAHIYGIEASGDSHALVMELVEGPTLAERLASGPLSLEESLSLARQIADALEAAHEKGIVHRDLKPQNIKITSEAEVKVLDFGLAKAMDPAGAVSGTGSASHVAASPTLTLGATMQGVLLGTAGYMAPEQAKGVAVDKRADIWAFGVVLWEMLTARRLFDGDSVPETLAGVLKTEIDLGALPAETPLPIRRLLRRCLERNPRNRLRDIGDARLELREASAEDVDGSGRRRTEAAGSRGRWLVPALLLAGILGGLGIGRLLQPSGSVQRESTGARLTLSLPAEAPVAAGNFLPSLAFSSDGAALAYVALGEDGVRRLAVRRLDRDEAMVIPGTEGAEGPFFSPDGEWIGFWSAWKIRRVRSSGAGVPEIVCDSLDFRGATWAGDRIVFAPAQGAALLAVAATGGKPEPFTELGPDEAGHRFPLALPDGDTVLFVAWKSPFDADRAEISTLSLSTGKRKDLGKGGFLVRYSPTAHLLYVQAGRLLAVPFDLERLEITGDAREILGPVLMQRNTGATQFDVSPRGHLAWVPGDYAGDEVRLLRVSRSGERQTILETDTVRRYPVLSSDDSEVMIQAIGPKVDGQWILSVEGSAQRRLAAKVWSGRWFSSGRWVATTESNSVFVDSIDGSSPRRELLPPGSEEIVITGMSPDGRIAYATRNPRGDLDTWLIDVEGGDPEAFLDGPEVEAGATFSPDGRYAAYLSDRSGQFEVYVTSFPDRSSTWQVSTEGGSEVVWRRDGREIVYRSGSRLISVPVELEPTFRAGTPSPLMDFPYDGVLGSPGTPNYDVSRDGSWLVLVDNPDLNRPARQVEIALDWPNVVAPR